VDRKSDSKSKVETSHFVPGKFHKPATTKNIKIICHNKQKTALYKEVNLSVKLNHRKRRPWWFFSLRKIRLYQKLWLNVSYFFKIKIVFYSVYHSFVVKKSLSFES